MDEFYTKHYDKLLWFCMKLTQSNREFAEDIVQETYLRAVQNAHIFTELNERQQSSWLYRTAKNIFVDTVRRRAKAPNLTKEKDVVKEEGFDAVDVEELLQALTAEERELYRMRYELGYRSNEIGEKLHIPASTIRARLITLRKKLLKLYWE